MEEWKKRLPSTVVGMWRSDKGRAGDWTVDFPGPSQAWPSRTLPTPASAFAVSCLWMRQKPAQLWPPRWVGLQETRQGLPLLPCKSTAFTASGVPLAAITLLEPRTESIG